MERVAVCPVPGGSARKGYFRAVPLARHPPTVLCGYENRRVRHESDVPPLRLSRTLLAIRSTMVTLLFRRR